MGKLGIYLLANYPSREGFLDAVKACQDLAVDFLEVGFAFSDPVADGDLLERASQETLKHYTVNDFIETFQRARTLFTRKTYIMTYANIVYSLGMDRFVEKVSPLTGLILADLPVREIPRFEKGFKRRPVNLIRFLTPESRPEDVATALKDAKDFIYFVSKRGTTGGAFELDRETRERIAGIRGRGVDVFIGFGIQSKEDLEMAYGAADGAIIGTKAVRELEGGIDHFREFPEVPQGVSGYRQGDHRDKGR